MLKRIYGSEEFVRCVKTLPTSSLCDDDGPGGNEEKPSPLPESVNEHSLLFKTWPWPLVYIP